MKSSVTWIDHFIGSGEVVICAPHAASSLDAARGWLADPQDPFHEAWRREWDEHLALFAALAAGGMLGATVLSPVSPRSVLDLGRPCRVPVEVEESLSGRSAIDSKTRSRMTPNGVVSAERFHALAVNELRRHVTGARVYIETHLYGKFGSTFDVEKGLRAQQRPEFSIVSETAPWSTGKPMGVSRFIPADLRPTSYSVRAAVERAVHDIGLEPGPSPYVQKPWSLTARVVADRFFGWLVHESVIDRHMGDSLRDLVWNDPFANPSGSGFDDLARRVGGKEHDLTALFQHATGQVALTCEIRIDLAPAWANRVGRAIARGVQAVD